ncbi:conserved hypothetical protein [Candidatus Sulfopaludibacter sp. SbA4]|nr:conserved hypothetical protein [Candidatus Sulfopaludibacter sp. SbA4]
MLIQNSRGGYSFLKGGAAYSAGVVAADGFTIEHVRLAHPVPWRAGFEQVDAHLGAAGRPRAALCAIALRSPAPLSFDGFREFNRGYVEVLKSWDVMADGVNPVARTNVAPELDPPGEPSLYSFACTVPATGTPLSFVVAGAGEVPDGSSDVVCAGETSPDAMAAKARFVLGLIEQRLHGLGAAWNDVAVTNIYSVHDVNALLHSEILPRIGPAAAHGVTWHYSRPPIVSIEYEMDVRGGTRDYHE